ncbi:MAG: hypothetical protein Q7I92_12180, partial [Humidesulfovibrio sp.]|nr:hypothetical protein [Humidesulfovibrio sp.]
MSNPLPRRGGDGHTCHTAVPEEVLTFGKDLENSLKCKSRHIVSGAIPGQSLNIYCCPLMRMS